MENKSNDKLSKELLKVEANMNEVPTILQMKQKQKPQYTEGSTFKPPPSSVLDRVRSFLPTMAQANADITKQMSEAPPGAFDIEDITDCERVIEMNIALTERDASDNDSESDTDSEVSDLDSDCQDCIRADELHENMDTLLAKQKPKSLKLPTSSSKSKPTIEILEANVISDCVIDSTAESQVETTNYQTAVK